MNIGKNENELTFLIVDDQKDILTLCHALIQDAFNFKKVFTASDGDEARRLIKVNQIDIVLSDIRMPGLDGLQLCRWLRGEARFSQALVIMLSAKASARPAPHTALPRPVRVSPEANNKPDSGALVTPAPTLKVIRM